MNLQQLTYFAAVARCRNFTRAAESCFVAQPALSQQIRKLEEELGLPLFERCARGVVLTAAGAAFLECAEEALRMVQQGRQRVADLRDVRKGVVTIVCLPTVAAYWLPRVVAMYRSDFPDAEIVIQEKAGITPSEFEGALFDFALGQLPEESTQLDPAMRVENLFVDEQVLMLPRGHRLLDVYPEGEPIPIRELADEPLVLPSPECGMRRTIARAFVEARVQPCVHLQTSQIEAIYGMVLAGLGVGFMPAMALHRCNAGVAWRRVIDPAPRRTIALVTSNVTTLSPVAASLVETVRAHAKITWASLERTGMPTPNGPCHELAASS